MTHSGATYGALHEVGPLQRATRAFLSEGWLFNFAPFSKVRSYLYSRAFHSDGMNVGQRAVVKAAHGNPLAGFSFGIQLRMGPGSYIDCSGGVSIGDRVQLSEDAKVFTHEHAIDEDIDIRMSRIRYSPLRIDDDVWIGANAVVTESVKRIGRGAVIAAGSVVIEDVPSLAVVGGVPARHLRDRIVRS